MAIMKIMYIKLNKLSSDEEAAATFVRLMMACNDLTLTNACLAKYQDDNKKQNKYLLRKCNSCGDDCYGSYCRECFSKNQHVNLSRMKTQKRYYEKRKTNGKNLL